MALINLTPHKVTVLDKDGNILMEIETSGYVPRIGIRRETILSLSETIGVPVWKSVPDECNGLPIEYRYEQAGTYLIVSRVVKAQFPDRKDLLVPDELVRDDDGRVIGCLGFSV